MEMEISILISILTWVPQKKAKLTTSVHHFKGFPKSGIPTEQLEKEGQAIVKRYVLHANDKKKILYETSKEKLFLRPKHTPKQETIVTFIL